MNPPISTGKFEFDVWHPLMLYKDVGDGMQTQLCVNKTDFFKLVCFVNVATCFDFMSSSQYAPLKYMWRNWCCKI